MNKTNNHDYLFQTCQNTVFRWAMSPKFTCTGALVTWEKVNQFLWDATESSKNLLSWPLCLLLHKNEHHFNNEYKVSTASFNITSTTLSSYLERPARYHFKCENDWNDIHFKVYLIAFWKLFELLVSACMCKLRIALVWDWNSFFHSNWFSIIQNWQWGISIPFVFKLWKV